MKFSQNLNFNAIISVKYFEWNLSLQPETTKWKARKNNKLSSIKMKSLNMKSF